MKVIAGKRGAGKTHALIQESMRTGATIVTDRRSVIALEIGRVTEDGKTESYLEPITYHEFLNKSFVMGRAPKGYLIDNIEHLLAELTAYRSHIEAFTVSSEDLVEVRREDWERKSLEDVRHGWANKKEENDITPLTKFKGTTTDRNDPDLRNIMSNGMQQKYLVLSEEERKKGFVRPYRDTYKHLKCGATTTMGRALSETYARNPKFYGATYCVHCGAHFPLKDYVGETTEYKAQFVWTADGEAVGE